MSTARSSGPTYCTRYSAAPNNSPAIAAPRHLGRRRRAGPAAVDHPDRERPAASSEHAPATFNHPSGHKRGTGQLPPAVRPAGTFPPDDAPSRDRESQVTPSASTTPTDLKRRDPPASNTTSSASCTASTSTASSSRGGQLAQLPPRRIQVHTGSQRYERAGELRRRQRSVLELDKVLARIVTGMVKERRRAVEAVHTQRRLEAVDDRQGVQAPCEQAEGDVTYPQAQDREHGEPPQTRVANVRRTSSISLFGRYSRLCPSSRYRAAMRPRPASTRGGASVAARRSSPNTD